MIRYMLDTNAVSQAVRNHPGLLARLTKTPVGSICLSCVSLGEIIYGLTRRPEAVRLRQAVHQLLVRLDVLAWDEPAASRYGQLRADLAGSGRALGPLDLLIAAHAQSTNATLVTHDAGFSGLAGLTVEDWQSV